MTTSRRPNRRHAPLTGGHRASISHPCPVGADDGYALTLFLVAFTMTLLVVTALTVDGGRILSGRRSASTTAFAAARIGAQSYTVSESGAVVLNPALIAWRVDTYLNEKGFPVHSVTVSGDVVTVTIEHHVTTVLLHLAGVSTKTVSAYGDARPISGVTRAGG